MEQREALTLLGEVERVRRRTRAEIGALWFPLVVFGALSLFSAPLNEVELAIYWAVAAPIGVVLVSFFYYRRERSLGVESRLLPTAVAIGVIIVGTAVTGSLGGILGFEMVSAVGPSLAVSAGLLMFARIEHSPPLAGVALGMAALAVALAAMGAAPDMVASLLAATGGAAAVLLGLGYRLLGR